MKKLIGSLLSLYLLVTVSTAQSIILDGKAPVRDFDGLGGIASYDKLLYDYPEPQRSDMLDYLFKPGYGAALQILKVEIGYDGNNTGTAWPAHQRSLNEKPDFTRGPVWWLMKEAKKRNPEIGLAALHWGYPAWASSDELKARFIFDFVRGSMEKHGLLIDYIGGNQNETEINTGVTVLLRRMLDDNGFKQVKIVVADEGSRGGYAVGDFLEKEKDYLDATDIVGVHYKSRTELLPKKIRASGKKMWSSEDGGGSYHNDGAAYQWVTQIIRLLHDIKLNGIIRWMVTAGAYDNIAWPNTGIMKAKEPWSGHYQVGANSWGFAHFTHFTKPGWKIMDTKESYLFGEGDANKSARFIALRDEMGKDFSMVLTTGDAQMPEAGMEIEIKLENGLQAETLHVWKSDFSKKDQWFIQQPDMKVVNGTATMKVEKNCVYSFSTLETAGKGTAVSPSNRKFPLPYEDDFDGYEEGALPRYFVDTDGGFEAVPALGGRKGMALQQMVEEAPVHWHYKSRPLSQPLTEIGDMDWKDYAVETDVLFKTPGRVAIAARFDGKSENSGDFLLEGYWFFMDEKGNWELMVKDAPDWKRTPEQLYRPAKLRGKFISLASGKIPGPGLSKWISCKIVCVGNEISVYANGKKLGEVKHNMFGNGNVSIGCMDAGAADFFSFTENYPIVQFDHFRVVPATKK